MKRINPERIKSIKVSMNSSTNEMSDGVKSLIEAPVTGNFEECVKLTKKSMGNLVKTVDSLDAYLNSVADAFAKTDASLAASIDGGLYSVPPKQMWQEKQESYISEGKNLSDRYNRRKLVDVYNGQYNDFPS